MKKYLKKITKFIAKLFVNFLFIFNSGRYFLEKINLNVSKKKFKVIYNDKTYKFCIPNRINYYRAQTFATKEPDTINWIKTFKEGSVFWDVGANIGIYSCFASKERLVKTYAFEPSTFNLDILSKNIFNNNLSDKIIIVPISLSDKTKISDFNMSKILAGGSQSTFSKEYNEDGINMKTVFRYKTLGLSGNDLINKLKLDKPDYIKIDVDGIEDLILNGFSEIINNTKSILIEVTETFQTKKNNIKIFLENKGFNLVKNENFNLQYKIYNQIWINKNIK